MEDKKRGRPASTRNRNKRLHIALFPEERTLIETAMIASNETMSNFIRRAAREMAIETIRISASLPK